MSVFVFAGTSEGRALLKFLSARGVCATAFVATEYGEQALEPMPGVTVRAGRLSQPEMERVLAAGAVCIDATHPYASEVSRLLEAACANTGAEYLRLVRPALTRQGADTVPDTESAVRWLNDHPGRVLLTTGSKELAAYTAVKGFAERIYPRVLPTAAVIEVCVALGFPPAHLIAMQGPFSRELNAALLRQVGAEILVTKDTGRAGGFAEKLNAARDAGARVLVVSRPREEAGRTLSEMRDYLTARLGLAKALPEAPRFPLFVPLAGRLCVIFGAGKIAARRASVLRRFGAEVRVIAPESPAGLALYAARGYEPGDLTGAFLAVAATSDRAVNARVAADCRAAGVPCSVADRAGESTFFFPAICEGNGLVAGVVSDGAHHEKTALMAKRIRAVLEETDEND